MIYGDIGTSPLYVFSSVFGDTPPARDDLIGVLSLIIWSLIMMVTIKYVFIVLHADNEGEGGTFSCYSLLSRYARIVHRDPREEQLVSPELLLLPNVRLMTTHSFVRTRLWLGRKPDISQMPECMLMFVPCLGRHPTIWYQRHAASEPESQKLYGEERVLQGVVKDNRCACCFNGRKRLSLRRRQA